MPKFLLIALSLILLAGSCRERADVGEYENQEEMNRAALVAFMESGWNDKDLSVIDAYFAENIVRKVNNVNLATSKNELSANMQVYFTGFPDLEITLDNMVSNEDEIYISWTITGTNTGVFGELPPTGKPIKVSGISRINYDPEGKIVQEEVFYNELSLLQQMGHTLSPPAQE